MNKGLEALFEIIPQLKVSKENNERIDTIEINLKRLETLEEEKQSFDRATEKKLKALEIIKREPSMVGWQAGYEDYEDYLDNTPEEQRFIKNKEEYELLKEALL